jgi:hypothetical protein
MLAIVKDIFFILMRSCGKQSTWNFSTGAKIGALFKLFPEGRREAAQSAD